MVLTLSVNEGSAVRGAILALAYSLGLGLPFVVLGVAFVRFAGALAWVRTHQRAVMRTGGILMMLVGLALVGIAVAVFMMTRGGGDQPAKTPGRDAGGAMH